LALVHAAAMNYQLS